MLELWSGFRCPDWLALRGDFDVLLLLLQAARGDSRCLLSVVIDVQAQPTCGCITWFSVQTDWRLGQRAPQSPCPLAAAADMTPSDRSAPLLLQRSTSELLHLIVRMSQGVKIQFSPFCCFSTHYRQSYPPVHMIRYLSFIEGMNAK